MSGTLFKFHKLCVETKKRTESEAEAARLQKRGRGISIWHKSIKDAIQSAVASGQDVAIVTDFADIEHAELLLGELTGFRVYAKREKRDMMLTLPEFRGVPSLGVHVVFSTKPLSGECMVTELLTVPPCRTRLNLDTYVDVTTPLDLGTPAELIIESLRTK